MLSLEDEILQLKNEIASLQLTIKEKELQLEKIQGQKKLSTSADEEFVLQKRDIKRFSRQIIIPQIQVQGQLKLKKLSVLIVGVGGLGCPAALYLTGAGVGCIGLIDYDIVEESNLHRQLLHNEDQLGKSKVSSAAIALKKLNSGVCVREHRQLLDSSSALALVQQYDVVVDASDNVATRYLINDACVLASRPLVSGSALQLEGQLTVYHHAGGPCYRCLYPEPPPSYTVTNCSDAGVLGPVPGVIGTLQALEVLKIALGMNGVLSSKLLLFDGETSSFRTVKLRNKKENCVICGTTPSITKLIDYEQFCGAAANDKDQQLSILNENERISAEELKSRLQSASPCVVVDVRQEVEYNMCSIPESVNIPLPKLIRNVDQLQTLATKKASDNSSVLVCMVCRRGNDSQLAVKQLKPLLTAPQVQLVDLRGGLHSWAIINTNFPDY